MIFPFRRLLLFTALLSALRCAFSWPWPVPSSALLWFPLNLASHFHSCVPTLVIGRVWPWLTSGLKGLVPDPTNPRLVSQFHSMWLLALFMCVCVHVFTFISLLALVCVYVWGCQRTAYTTLPIKSVLGMALTSDLCVASPAALPLASCKLKYRVQPRIELASPLLAFHRL